MPVPYSFFFIITIYHYNLYVTSQRLHLSYFCSMEEKIHQILQNLKIEQLNEMQLASIDAIQKQDDVILLSSTGSGKTLAFLLPVLQRLDKTNNATQALVVVPSRELALQIEQVFKNMGTGFKVTTCYGGHKREIE